MKQLLAHALRAALSATLLLPIACGDDEEPPPVATPSPSNPTNPNNVSFVYRIDRQNITALSPTAGYQNNELLLEGITSPRSLSISIRNPNTSGSTNGATIIYAESGQRWSTVGGTSVVTLGEFNTATKRVSGSFRATLVPVAGTTATGTKTLTDGSFIGVEYQ